MGSDEGGLEAIDTAGGGVVGGNEVAGVLLLVGAAEASDKRDLAISCS